MTDAPPPSGLALEAAGLSKRFGAVLALDGVGLRVGVGEAVALFGPNGAGKTTLLRILGLGLRPGAGWIRVAGLDPQRDERAIRRRIGVISHQSFLYDDLTARENLQLFARLYAVPEPTRRSDELLARFELEHRAHDRVRELSRGLQQRLALARALVHDPAIVLLDEPFSGLDPHAAEVLRNTLHGLRGRGRTFLLVTHDLQQGLELAERWIVLARGRIVNEGPSRGTDAATFAAAYFERSPR